MILCLVFFFRFGALGMMWDSVPDICLFINIIKAILGTSHLLPAGGGGGYIQGGGRKFFGDVLGGGALKIK